VTLNNIIICNATRSISTLFSLIRELSLIACLALLIVCILDTAILYIRFYRAMHFSAKRSHVVCPSVRLSVTLVDCDHIGWNSSEIILPSVSLGRSLFATPT